MKTIAVIGAGFCGLAVAWELLKKNSRVHIYDSAGIGGGASGVSAGLLHPFTGVHAKLAREGNEGMQATLELLAIASQSLGEAVYQQTEMLRLAVSKEMAADFQQCARENENVLYLTAEECQKRIPGLASLPGIMIQNAYIVRSQPYLQGLWTACQAQGAQFFQQKIASLSALTPYDQIVVAMGSATCTLPELAHLPLTQVKGQVLELAWPKQLLPLSLPLNAHAYILMQPDNRSCLVGATYERNFSTGEPAEEVAVRELMPKATALLPALQGAAVIRCLAGIRASAPGHQPLLQQIDPRTWVLAGMGSKGILYHALYAKKLCGLLTI